MSIRKDLGMRHLVQSTMLAVILMLFSACGGSSAPPVVPTAASVPVTTAPTSAPAPAQAAKLNELTVFAPPSLTDAFMALSKRFETTNPATKINVTFASSQQIAERLIQGDQADLIITVGKKPLSDVIQAGRVVSGTQQIFAQEQLVVVYAKSGATNLTHLKDLAKPGVRIALQPRRLPAGQFSLNFLDKASKDPTLGTTFKDSVLKNAVIYTQNAHATLDKVRQGAVDAGIVYTSDVTSDIANVVGVLPIPSALNAGAVYTIAPIVGAKHNQLAQTFLSYLLSQDGQAIVSSYGFLPAK